MVLLVFSLISGSLYKTMWMLYDCFRTAKIVTTRSLSQLVQSPRGKPELKTSQALKLSYVRAKLFQSPLCAPGTTHWLAGFSEHLTSQELNIVNHKTVQRRFLQTLNQCDFLDKENSPAYPSPGQ